MRNPRVIIVSVLLAGYYLFTSGFVFEATKSETTDHIDTPYSFAFSSQRVNLVSIPSQDDIRAAKWLSENGLKTIPVQSGYNGQLLVWSYGMGDRLATPEYKGRRYSFVTTWSSENDEWVWGHNGGLRYFIPLPEFDESKMIFSSGSAKIYLVEG